MSWRDDAACLGRPTQDWFPETAGVRGPTNQAAIELCRTCTVSVQCLQAALDTPEIHGIWGGATERQRRGMRRTHRPDFEHGTQNGYLRHHRYGEPACRACRDGHNRYQDELKCRTGGAQR